MRFPFKIFFNAPARHLALLILTDLAKLRLLRGIWFAEETFRLLSQSESTTQGRFLLGCLLGSCLFTIDLYVLLSRLSIHASIKSPEIGFFHHRQVVCIQFLFTHIIWYTIALPEWIFRYHFDFSDRHSSSVHMSVSVLTPCTELSLCTGQSVTVQSPVTRHSAVITSGDYHITTVCQRQSWRGGGGLPRHLCLCTLPVYDY